ncbi:glycosyltransferase family 2 protein [Yoonia sp. MH D7]
MTQHQATFSSALIPLRGINALSGYLIDEHLLSHSDAILAQSISVKGGQRLADVLTIRFGIASLSIAEAHSSLYQALLINPHDTPPTPRLVDRFGPAQAAQTGLLPWRVIGRATVVLTDKPDQFERHIDALTNMFGPIRMAVTTTEYIEKYLIAQHSPYLAHRAETKVPSAQSSRLWHARRTLICGSITLAALCLCAILFPQTTFGVLCAWTTLILILTTILKACAAIACLTHNTIQKHPLVIPARLPRITLLVPLFRETEIAGHLLARLREIDYPRELLDVCLVTEGDDMMTRDALGKTVLPTWMRSVIVPEGTLRTKPRALNFALDFAKGSLIGIYDAEDAPDPDQLRKVALHFANCGPDVVCVQGVLDYYNDSTNWLTRCFTIEYATWFRIVLPGLARMGFVVPLGGTTLFFKRDILESLGGWDAHNVTEDADLGVRLARAGYHTELISSVTQEEANGRAWPWVKQRSRWLKGYAITYAVHMRNPRQLWQDLGAKRFFGVQLLFLGTLSQFVLQPILWSFWLVPLGVPHPILNILSHTGFWTLAGVYFASEIVNLIVAAIALKSANKVWLIKWAVTLQVYFPLAALAVYKGLFELAWKPFYWDKTMHGVLLPDAPKAPPPPPAHLT